MVLITVAMDAQGLKGFLNKAKEKMDKASGVVEKVLQNPNTQNQQQKSNQQTSQKKQTAKEQETKQRQQTSQKLSEASSTTDFEIPSESSYKSTESSSQTIVKTIAKGLDYSDGDYFVNTQTQLSLPKADVKNCVCFLLMTNSLWKDELNLHEFSGLSSTLCHKEVELSDVLSGKSGTIDVAVPLEAKGLKGKDSLLYIRAYIFDTNNIQIIAKSEFTPFYPGSVLTKMMKQNARNYAISKTVAEGVLTLIQEDSSVFMSTPTHSCSVCGKNRICQQCYVYSYEEKKGCSHCEGSGVCPNYKPE